MKGDQMGIKTNSRIATAALGLVIATTALAQSNGKSKAEAYTNPSAARVFITDSASWEIGGHSGGYGAAGGSEVHGGARPQTAEIIKTFGERCPEVAVNNIQTKADYVVLLDHEGGKRAWSHKNKVAVFARLSGDSIVSKSTLSLGGSVQEACEAIKSHWAQHSSEMRAATAASPAAPSPLAAALAPGAATDSHERGLNVAGPLTAPPAISVTAKISITSVPDGADIEIDGGFLGNTPSDIEIPAGEHAISVKKAGYTTWERKLKVNAGSTVHLSAVLEKP